MALAWGTVPDQFSSPDGSITTPITNLEEEVRAVTGHVDGSYDALDGDYDGSCAYLGAKENINLMDCSCFEYRKNIQLTCLQDVNLLTNPFFVQSSSSPSFTEGNIWMEVIDWVLSTGQFYSNGRQSHQYIGSFNWDHLQEELQNLPGRSIIPAKLKGNADPSLHDLIFVAQNGILGNGPPPPLNVVSCAIVDPEAVVTGVAPAIAGQTVPHGRLHTAFRKACQAYLESNTSCKALIYTIRYQGGDNIMQFYVNKYGLFTNIKMKYGLFAGELSTTTSSVVTSTVEWPALNPSEDSFFVTREATGAFSTFSDRRVKTHSASVLEKPEMLAAMGFGAMAGVGEAGSQYVSFNRKKEMAEIQQGYTQANMNLNAKHKLNQIAASAYAGDWMANQAWERSIGKQYAYTASETAHNRAPTTPAITEPPAPQSQPTPQSALSAPVTPRAIMPATLSDRDDIDRAEQQQAERITFEDVVDNPQAYDATVTPDNEVYMSGAIPLPGPPGSGGRPSNSPV
jgi:hypothetical protein